MVSSAMGGGVLEAVLSSGSCANNDTLVNLNTRSLGARVLEFYILAAFKIIIRTGTDL